MSAGYILYSLDWGKFQQFVARPTPAQLSALAAMLRDEIEEHDDDSLDLPKGKKALSQWATTRLALPDWYGDLSYSGKCVWEGAVFEACTSDEFDLGFRVDNDGIYWDVIELAWKKLGVVPNRVSDVALSAFGVRPYRYHQPALSNQPLQGRDDFDRAEAEKRSSLIAIGTMLGQFLEGAKRGEKQPDDLMRELNQNQGVSQQHKDLFKDLLSDDDSDDDEEDGDDDDSDWTPMHSMHAPEEVQKMRAELESVGPAIKKAKSREVRKQYEDDLMPALEAIAADGRMLFVQVDT